MNQLLINIIMCWNQKKTKYNDLFPDILKIENMNIINKLRIIDYEKEKNVFNFSAYKCQYAICAGTQNLYR